MNKKIIALLLATSAFVAVPPAPRAAEIAPAAPASRVKISGHLEAGFTGNLDQPRDNQNFGRLFDDRANEPLLNQLLLTAERALDANAKGFDWGFKLQGLVGSDARYIHSLGLLDDSSWLKSTVQPDIVEAYLNTHFVAEGTAGGIDVKWGKFVTLEGAEVIDSTGNAFYSHSYLFNFGIPFNHTGALATIHATKDLDLMLGVTRGVNTSLKDNNNALAFHGGFSLPNLAGGKVALTATTHVGPETPRNSSKLRYLNDVLLVYKVDSKLTATTDLNYIYDDLAKAKGYGVAQYFSYAVSPSLAVNFRGEIWRDQNGFFVAQFASNQDFVRLLRGDSFSVDPRTVGGGSTTYGALTVGAVFKPAENIVIRPEVRYDASLNGTKPFKNSNKGGLVALALDVTFSF
jgi:hypothetical protein